MKKFISLFSLVTLVFLSYSQDTTIALEKFGSIPVGWTVSPTGGWDLDYGLYESDSSSICGLVPNSTGDSTVLTSPFYDFRNYAYVFLRFNHICKVVGTDICKIYIQENYTGARWRELSTSIYKGTDPKAYLNARFSQMSYASWLPSDSLAIPTNAWWKTELFDLANEASYAQVRFKFVIKRGSGAGTQFAYGWLIDDFELIASQYEIKPPIMEDLSGISDTVYQTGPFAVQVRISPQTFYKIIQPINLVVKYQNPTLPTTYDTIQMAMIEGDTIFGAMIPQKTIGTTITYYIYAHDSVGNDGALQYSFYIKKPAGGGQTGYVTVGFGTTTQSYIPFYRTWDFSWSRMLFLAKELSSNSTGGLIKNIAFNVSTAGAQAPDQTCYFKVVSDNSISNTAYLDPVANGATLVWSGTFNPVLGWNDFTLDNPFYLPPGKNLLVYWQNNADNYTTNSSFYSTSTSPTYMTVYDYDDGAWPTGPGTLYYNRPNTRFYLLGGSDDTNSVALYTLNYPKDSVVAAPGLQVPVIATIKNKGYANLDSCLINWSLNGVLQPSHTWRGSLSWDFNATDTIGWYTPSVNDYDTLLVWTSLPNGQYDSTTYDDTIKRHAFGVTGLNMAFISNFADTVYNTGPYDIKAVIFSRTSVPVSTPIYLYVTSVYGTTTTYDTILMQYTSNDTFVGRIPQHIFGTNISYSISIMDAVGNLVSINNQFYIKRLPGGGTTGYVIVGTGTNTQEYVPFYRLYDYSWARVLYLSSELSPSLSGGMITKLAWHVSSTGVSGINQTCYFKEVSDVNITNTNYIDPITNGATLVWSGTYNPSVTGWIEINLDVPFLLTPGKNLMIFWENRDGVYTSPYAAWTSTSTLSNMAVHDFQDGSFPTGSGQTEMNRPNARFYFIATGSDSNAVGMHSIDYPLSSILATPNGDSVGVLVTLKNKGILNLTSCDVSWALNGIYKGTKHWTGNLTEDFNDTITVGYYKPRASMTDVITTWVNMPNGVTDSTTYDDTLVKSVYGKAAVEATLIGPNDTIYSTGPYAIKARLISLTSLPVDTNVFLYVSTTYGGSTTYDTIRMINTGNDTIWSTVLKQHAYGSYVNYYITATDSLGNNIIINKWFYVKRPNIFNLPDPDSVLVTQPANGGVFVIPFDCRLPQSWSRVIYTSTELGIADTGAVLNWIAWQSYSSTAYVYPTTRTNVSIYIKAIDETETSITNNNYIDPVFDGATLVFDGTLNLSGNLNYWEKASFSTPFYVPGHKNIMVYVIDQHGTGGNTFAWTYYHGSGGTIFGGAMTTGTLDTYKPWTSFGFTCWPNDSDGVAAYAFVEPKPIVDAGIQTPVKVVIVNKGLNNLTSCNIDWTLNGVPQATYQWTGNLYEDFLDTLLLGSYMPNSANYDNIKVWVSLPNGKADTNNLDDDTLEINVYAKAGLVAEYVAPFVRDTVTVTGPFEIRAHIQSLTSIPLPIPTMYLSYTFNNLTTYDTILMTTLFTDSLFKVNIPQLPYGTHVTYSITVVDSIGNLVTINDWFYVKRVQGGSGTGYVIVGTGTNTQYQLPMNMFYRYGWTRQIYMADELNPSSAGGLITKLAWEYAYSVPYVYYNQACYFEAVDASVTTITSNSFVDPNSVGAPLVWYGTVSLSQGWVEFTLDQPFLLLPGKNLIVHWHHNNGAYPNTSYVFNYTPTTYNTAVYNQSDNSFPTGAGTLTNKRPNARFYIVGSGDYANSAALVSILSPADTTPSFQQTPIQVVIRNKGMENLTSCKIDWTLNGVSQPTYNWTGNLMEDFTDTVILDYFFPLKNQTYNFTFKVSLPNNVYDSTAYDDTLSWRSFSDYYGYNLTMNTFKSPVVNPNEVCFAKQTQVKIQLQNTGKSAFVLSNTPLTLNYKATGPVSIQKSLVFSKGTIPVGIKEFVLDSMLDIKLPGIYHIEVISNVILDTIYFDDTLRMDYEVKRIVLPYDNDFSSSITDITFKSTSDSINWSQNLTPAISPVYGTGVLQVNSSLAVGTTATATLDAIDFQGSLAPSLEFWFAHDTNNPTNLDNVVVKVSNDGGNNFTTKDIIYRYDTSYSTPGWQHYTIDLSDYANDACVIIALEANSDGGGDMWIDRLLVSSQNELEIALVIPKLEDLVACNLDQKELKVSIINKSVMDFNFDETLSLLTLEVSGAVNKIYVDTLSGILSGFATMDVVIDNQFDFTTAGNYDFVAYINNIDVNTLNDTDRTNMDIQPDVSLISINEIGTKSIGSLVYLTVKISNTGNVRVQEVPLHIQVDGINDVLETAYIDLAAGTDTSYMLHNPYKVPVEPTYQLQIVSELSCDYIRSNDTLLVEGTVSAPTIKVASILKPSSTACDTGLKVLYPQVIINNTGNIQTNVVVYFIVDSAGKEFANFIDTIALVSVGDNTYNFNEYYIVPNWQNVTTYHVTAYIYSPTYALKQDACLIFNDVSIDEMNNNILYLGQNIPNPVQKSTSIPFVIPEEGSIILSLMSVSGQTLYMEKKEYAAGKHWIEMDVDKLANGIYYYSIEYKGQRLVKKLTIQK